ncbi:MAG: hypothetical protein M3O70_23690 [Actinomycetota bacterium]|nr:hypothetical protein [Actinomycetota bacterium]
MEVILIIVVLLLVGAVAVACRRRRQPAGPPSAGPTPSRARPPAPGPLSGAEATITLDIDAADPENPAVQRLVRDAASHAFRTSPHLDAVIVEDRSGKRLGLVERDQRPPAPTPVAPEVPEPGRRPSWRPSGSWDDAGTADRARVHDLAPQRSFADRFDLPEVVRANLRRPDDPVDVVRAILEAARLPLEVHGNMMLSSGEAVIVVTEAGGLPSEVLTDAFLRFQKSGASQGVVITPGYVGVRDIQRREALAPHLRYTGLSAIQRMADAVALGANPLRFAIDPAIVE